MKTTHFILCPVFKNKTWLKMREDTEFKNFPLYCPKCKQEMLIFAFSACAGFAGVKPASKTGRVLS